MLLSSWISCVRSRIEREMIVFPMCKYQSIATNNASVYTECRNDNEPLIMAEEQEKSDTIDCIMS